MKQQFNPSEEGSAVVAAALDCWNSAETFRTARNRNISYTFGNQWCDYIEVNGRMMREDDYIRSQGNVPFVNNLIRRFVRNVVGVLRDRLSSHHEEGNIPASPLYKENDMDELFARTMEEFLISGMAVHRKWCGVRRGIAGIWTDIVSPSSFFYDPMARDPRGSDMSVLGQIHELSFREFCDAFIADRATFDLARSRYGSGNVKVVEVWRREQRPRMLCHDRERGVVVKVDETEWNEIPALRKMSSKWILDDVWRYYYAVADGTLLRAGDSPLGVCGHPYVVKGYPFLDGEIHSFVEDVIDQQRYTNRLITMYDWVMRASAKGVLLFPVEALSPGQMIEDVADKWSQYNGVILYKSTGLSQPPSQVSNASAQSGVSELLNIQLKMMEDIAGVNGALQGKIDSQTMSGTLYEQQTRNSLTSLRDILETFDTFILDSLAKDAALAKVIRS